jgi:hypothetical protein
LYIVVGLIEGITRDAPLAWCIHWWCFGVVCLIIGAEGPNPALFDAPSPWGLGVGARDPPKGCRCWLWSLGRGHEGWGGGAGSGAHAGIGLVRLRRG